MNLFTGLGCIAIFAYFALNWGEHHYHKPGWRAAVYIALLCLVGWLAWPYVAPFLLWMMPK